jgi:hypothetical protein
VKRTCNKDTRAGRVSAISQTKVTAIKAQWQTAHRSMQDGVAGRLVRMKLLYKQIVTTSYWYQLAERCLVGTRSMRE